MGTLTFCEIFCDSSFDPKTQKGIAAFSMLIDQNLVVEIHTTELNSKSCGNLEIKAAIWALEEFLVQSKNLILQDNGFVLKLYVDSMTIAKLPARRAKLELNQFLSLRTKQPLSNAEDYQKFFELYDQISRVSSLEIIWIKGHTPKSIRSREEALFSAVDHEARAKLRRLFRATRLNPNSI